jgi:hypothetical protein
MLVGMIERLAVNYRYAAGAGVPLSELAQSAAWMIHRTVWGID